MRMPCLAAVLPMLLVACGEKPAEEASTEYVDETPQTRTAQGVMPPNISVSAAPGVGFSYSYRFRLDAQRISAVQEEHAQACERLGLARCRIVGMRYSVRGQDMIEGMLAIKLAPSIARNFGKQGIEAVLKADGMLVNQEITGTELQSQIDRARENNQSIEDEIVRLERRLSALAPKAMERETIERRLAELRGEMRKTNVEIADTKDTLANTPMVFNYVSGGRIPGFGPGTPVRDAAEDAAGGFVWVVATAIRLLGIVLPLALFVLLLMWIWSHGGKRLVSRITTPNCRDGADHSK